MRLLLAFSIVLFSSQVFAWGLHELGEEAAVPISTDAKDILIYGGAATLFAVAFEDQFDVAHDEVVDKDPLGDLSRYGDWAGQMVPNIGYILGQSIAGYFGNEKGADRAIGMFKATAYSASVTTLLKYTIREPRPDNHDERNSFPSGHSTTAFAFGGYVFEEHGWKWGVPALMLATLTGLSRVNDNRHRVHDVLAGATIGLAYGVGLVKLSKKHHKNETSYNVVPIFDNEVKGIALFKRF